MLRNAVKIYLAFLVLLPMAAAEITDEDLYSVNPDNVDAIAKAITVDEHYYNLRYDGYCGWQAVLRYRDLTQLMKVNYPVYIANVIPYYHSIIAIQTGEDINDFNSYRFVQYHDDNIRPGDEQMPFYNDVWIIDVKETHDWGFGGDILTIINTGNKTIPYNVTDYSGLDKCRQGYNFTDGKCKNMTIKIEVPIPQIPKCDEGYSLVDGKCKVNTRPFEGYTFGLNSCDRIRILSQLDQTPHTKYTIENILWEDGFRSVGEMKNYCTNQGFDVNKSIENGYYEWKVR